MAFFQFLSSPQNTSCLLPEALIIGHRSTFPCFGTLGSPTPRGRMIDLSGISPQKGLSEVLPRQSLLCLLMARNPEESAVARFDLPGTLCEVDLRRHNSP